MLARTFARLCALEACRPSALLGTDNPAWPTLAANYVFDSSIDPVDDMALDHRRPIIIVYTEDDDQKKIAQGGPNFYASHINLVFEISVIQQAREGNDLIVGPVYSDTESEAQLDALEAQIFHSLHFGASGALFRKMTRLPFETWRSTVHRSSEEGLRIAMRTITGQIRLADTMTAPAPATAPTGLDRLPSALQPIAQALGGSTYLAAVVAGVAAAAPTMPQAVPLNTVGITVDAKTPATPEGADSEIKASAANLQG
jgi:hypothetical protein